MAAVTESGDSYSPPRASGRGRRRVLAGIVVAWIVVLAGLSVWSQRHDPATVPEQRDLGQALPELNHVVGAVVNAVGGDGRAVVLGGLSLDDTCRVTPVRQGVDAARDVTIYVRDGEEHGALDALAAGLPAAYGAKVTTGRGETRFTLHADAGNFIGIDAQGAAGSRTLTVHATTGCRPLPSGGVHPANPSPAAAPQALALALTDLRVTAPPKPVVSSVACPSGGVATTYAYAGLSAPTSLAATLKPLSGAGGVLYADVDSWTFQSGPDSLTAFTSGAALTLTATHACA